MESPNDMLSSLLSDPQKLQSALSMASSLLGQSADAPSTPAPSAATPPAASASAPTAPKSDPPAQAANTPLPAVNSKNSFPAAISSHTASQEYNPSAELLQKVMPMLNQFLRSGQTAVKPEKLHLLNAMKPFVSSDVGGQLDHAMRLVSVARMARTAMRQFGAANDTHTTEV